MELARGCATGQGSVNPRRYLFIPYIRTMKLQPGIARNSLWSGETIVLSEGVESDRFGSGVRSLWLGLWSGNDRLASLGNDVDSLWR